MKCQLNLINWNSGCHWKWHVIMVSCHNGLIHMSFFFSIGIHLSFHLIPPKHVAASHHGWSSCHIALCYQNIAANTSQQSASVPFLTVHQHQCLQQPIHPITRLAPLRRAFFEVHLGELCTQEVHGNIATLDSSGYCRSARRGPKL